MAAQYSLQRKPAALKHTVFFQRLTSVVRARWAKAAVCSQIRTNRHLVGFNQPYQDFFHPLSGNVTDLGSFCISS